MNILQRINFLLRRLFIRYIPKERNTDVSRRGRSDVQLSVTKFNPCGVKEYGLTVYLNCLTEIFPKGRIIILTSMWPCIVNVFF